MASDKELPAGVPEENEYHRLHWAVLLTYMVACGAIYMLLFMVNLQKRFLGRIRNETNYK